MNTSNDLDAVALGVIGQAVAARAQFYDATAQDLDDHARMVARALRAGLEEFTARPASAGNAPADAR